MNSSTAVFQFISQKVAQATGSDVLAGALMQDNLYEKIEGEKLIRVGDVQRGNFKLIGNSAKEVNAFLTVQFFVACKPDEVVQRIWARDTATEMAQKIAGFILDEEKLPDLTGASRVCDATIEQYALGWSKPGSTRYAVLYLQLKINNR